MNINKDYISIPLGFLIPNTSTVQVTNQEATNPTLLIITVTQSNFHLS